MIESVPSERIVDRYTDGSSVRKFEFVFASKEFYDDDVLLNLQNSEFYDNFCTWLEKITRERQLPEMGEGRTAQRIYPSSTPYVQGYEDGTARYQVQCVLEYYQPANFINEGENDE